jgi:hypothetical protein
VKKPYELIDIAIMGNIGFIYERAFAVAKQGRAHPSRTAHAQIVMTRCAARAIHLCAGGDVKDPPIEKIICVVDGSNVGN